MWQDMYTAALRPASALERLQQANLTAMSRTWQWMTDSFATAWGLPVQEAPLTDKRFSDPAWTANPALDRLKQAYLIAGQWMMDGAGAFQEIDPNLHLRAAFYTKQLVDALSPANVPFLNPTVVEETIRTGGMSWLQGMQNLIGDMLKGEITQVPEGAFKVGRDLAITPGKVVYRNKLIELIQYTPSTDQAYALPLLIIPPWINRYYVLDLRPKNSLVKYLVESGFTIFMISWKNPDSSLRDLSWEDYMQLGPMEALKVVQDITGAQRVNLVGYCIGGLLLETLMAYWAAKNDPIANSATYFAVHQDFGNVGELGCFISPPEVLFLDWLMQTSGGYLDGKYMGTTFDFLRANDLLWSYVINNYYLGKQPDAFDILAWNGDNTRVPEAIHSFYLTQFFLERKLEQPNGLNLMGTPIDLRKITTPSFVLAMKEDHIVPWKSAFKMRELVSAPIHFTLAESGHIAGVLNPPSAHKRGYWCARCDETDPDAWLTECSKREPGSWWPDWVEWLEERSGDKGQPPPIGSAHHSPIMDAPGTYVLEQ